MPHIGLLTEEGERAKVRDFNNLWFVLREPCGVWPLLPFPHSITYDIRSNRMHEWMALFDTHWKFIWQKYFLASTLFGNTREIFFLIYRRKRQSDVKINLCYLFSIWCQKGDEVFLDELT
jgi:hypothetical protein